MLQGFAAGNVDWGAIFWFLRFGGTARGAERLEGQTLISRMDTNLEKRNWTAEHGEGADSCRRQSTSGQPDGRHSAKFSWRKLFFVWPSGSHVDPPPPAMARQNAQRLTCGTGVRRNLPRSLLNHVDPQKPVQVNCSRMVELEQIVFNELNAF